MSLIDNIEKLLNEQKGKEEDVIHFYNNYIQNRLKNWLLMIYSYQKN